MRIDKIKALARVAAAPLIYRYPPFTLAPERLYLFLHHVSALRNVPGSIVEVGCNLGGTAAIAARMLKRIEIDKQYICVDTFDGFVEGQFCKDERLGTPAKHRHMFSGNPKRLVRKILQQHDCGEVKLIEGDIIALNESTLPTEISLALIDVDLVEPTYVALNKFWPRLSHGGVILIDDCPDQSDWKARIAYRRFCEENHIAERYSFGMGILEKGSQATR